MPSSALFDLLPDFGVRPERAEPVSAVPRPMPELRQEPDLGALIAEAVAEAQAETERRLAAEHQAALEAERQAHRAEAEAFLNSLGADMGATIAARIDAMQQTVIDLVSDRVARVVGGLLSEDLQKRALDALARIVREATDDSDAVRIRVSGPPSLYESLRAALGPRAANLDFTDAPVFDLTLSIEDTVFETRMAEWSDMLTEVLS